jgi:hypothetical protein
VNPAANSQAANAQLASVLLETLGGEPVADLVLRAGADLVVRVVQAPPEGGKGLVTLAGQLLEARLPPDLAPGQTLPVKIVDANAQQVLLRVRDDVSAPPAEHTAHATGALAVSGDPQLVKAAVVLAPPGLALPLPNGDALQLAVQPDAEDEGGGDGQGGAEAAFVLHSAELGPIEVRLRLDGGTVVANVAVDEGALPEAQAALPSLAAALERATGTAPRVGVAARAADAPAPARPRVAEGLDAYA